MIKAIIFDCFGVLTTDSWRAFCDSLPPEVDVEQARALNRQYDSGLLTKDEFLKQIYEITGQHPLQVEERLDNESTKNKVLLNYIATLKDQGYTIGLLSNIASNWIRDAFLTTQEQALFDEMVFSFEVGIAKPDPRIFLLACERLRVSTHEAIMVDDIQSYCEAAKSEGMQAVVYQDFQQMKAELEKLLSQA